MHCYRICLLAALGLLLGPTPLSIAQPQPAPTPVGSEPGAARPWETATTEQRERAKALVAQADEQYNDASVSRAVELYLEALKIWDHPAIHAPLAIAYNELDKPVEAFHHMQIALKYGAEPLGRNYEVALKRFDMIKKKVGTLVIKSTTAGAEVKLNGNTALDDIGEIAEVVRAGQRHIVTAKRKGMQTFTREPDVVGGSTVEVIVAMVPTQPKYVRRLKRAWLPYAALASGVVVAGFGGLMYAQAVGDRQQFDDLYEATCPTGCTRDQWDDRNPLLGDLDASMKRQSAFGIAGFAVGGALVATGVTLFFLNRPRAVYVDEEDPTPGGVTLAPLVGGGVAGLVAHGAF